MKTRLGILLLMAGGWFAGCGPAIKTITPTNKKPLDSVLVEGDGKGGSLKSREHAVIYVDDGAVGTPLFSYPKPEVFIPASRPDGKATAEKVEIFARNQDGKGNTVQYPAQSAHVNAPPVSVDAITPPAKLQFTNEIAVTVFGNGIFPGTHDANLDHPHAGPTVVQAVPVAGGANTTATKVYLLTPNSLQVFFADTLPRGLYRIYVKNDDRFGGMSATSTVTFEWK